MTDTDARQGNLFYPYAHVIHRSSWEHKLWSRWRRPPKVEWNALNLAAQQGST